MLNRRGFLGLLSALPFAHKLPLALLPPWKQVQMLMEEEIIRNARTTGYEIKWGESAEILDQIPTIRFNADAHRLQTELDINSAQPHNWQKDAEEYRKDCVRINARYHGKLCPFDEMKTYPQVDWHDVQYCECPNYLDGRPYHIRAEDGEQRLRKRLGV